MAIHHEASTPSREGAFLISKHKRQVGFGIIETVIVIILIGIMVAIAVPYFKDLSGSAKIAATEAVAAALNASSSTNALLSKVGDPTAVSVANCTDVANALPSSNPLPSGYVITSLSIASGATATCTLTNPEGDVQRTFIGRGT